jgi:hypothetical protein
MNESVDLRRLLTQWPYDCENDTRIAKGDDGRDILQVRTPMGMEQYELDGRPDGARPHGAESVLEYHLARQKKAGAESKAFKLTPRQCAELFNEGTLYYFRYVRLFQMRDWARTLRDTNRNLRAFDFLHEYAEREEDRNFLEKWRPYVLRVNASAAALLQLDRKHYDTAVSIVEKAAECIENLEPLEDDTFKFERDRSLTALRELATQIRKNRPMSELEQLEHQLSRAIDRQEFEKAAELRDRIRALRNRPASA